MEDATMAQGPVEGPNNTTNPGRVPLRDVGPTRPKRSKMKLPKSEMAADFESNPEDNGLQPRKRVKKELDEQLPRPELVVGCLKEDNKVPVVAYLTSTLALKYRLSKQEANDSKLELKHRQSPTQIQVKFLPEYGGDDKKIREDIKKKLKETFPEYRDQEEIKAGNDNVADDQAEVAIKALKQATAAHQVIHKVVVTQGATIVKQQDDINNKKTQIANLESQVEELTAQGATIVKQQDDINNKETQIANLESQVEQLTAQVNQLTNNALLSQNQKLVINDRTYDKFPAGYPNEGLYVTKQPQIVTIGDVDYSETIVLSEFKGLKLDGTLTDVVTLDGIPFKRISGGSNDGKLVQELGPHSILEHEGNFYVRTFIRTEKPLGL